MTIVCIAGRIKDSTEEFAQGTMCWLHREHQPKSGYAKVIAGPAGREIAVWDLQLHQLDRLQIRPYNYKAGLRWQGPREDAKALLRTLVYRPAITNSTLNKAQTIQL